MDQVPPEQFVVGRLKAAVAEQLDPYGDFDVQSPAEKSFDRLVGDECIAGIADRN